MPHVYTLKDGTNHTVFDEKDISYLIEKYMGHEIQKWFDGFYEEFHETQEELSELQSENEKLKGEIENGEYL